MNKLVHAAERKAFQSVLECIIKKGQTEDVAELADSLLNLVQKILGDSWTPEAYENLRRIFAKPDGKWVRPVII